AFGFLAIATIIILPAYADQTIQATSGGTIDVGFATDPANPTPGGQTNLNISFINKSTHSVQQHIDYKITIMEGNNQIGGTGQILHTAEGSIGYPFQFPDAAKYQIIIEVDGILFQPIPPETATFTVDLSGGGSTNANTSSNSNSTSSSGAQNSVIPSWVKKTAGWWSSGQVGDQDFVKGIQYMIQNGIMQIPQQSSSSATSGAQSIPSWVKKTAGWWSSGQVGDQDFVKGIQWLISNGIITV
ncbi:MAG TPA: hypothetical protein VJ771_07260, partial [Candidatus Nitrosotalea sp.]|nr:hypothetical protein [Candidatus Nitrosotalea sp.]